MGVRPRAIEVHIEELVLDGFARRDRLAIADAVEAELTRLIAEGGVGALGERQASVERVQAGSFRAEAGARGAAIGAETAKAVFGGITSDGDGGRKR
jgi:hypothetical protein